MAKFGEKPFMSNKKDKKDIPRKKSEKDRYQVIKGWEPAHYQDDFGIASWMIWQREVGSRKRKPETDGDVFRNLPLSKCCEIDNISRFENESLAESYRVRKSLQFEEEKFKKQEPEQVKKFSDATRRREPEQEISQNRLSKSAHVVIEKLAAANNYERSPRGAAKKEIKSASIVNKKNHSLKHKDKISDEDEDVNDDGYASKISSNEDNENGTEMRPVPLLDLIVEPDTEEPGERTASFRWLREKDNNGNTKITKLSFTQSDSSPNPSVNRNDIINSSKVFVTDYIKRCQPEHLKSQTDQRPKSLVMSRVAIQDSSTSETTHRSESVAGNRLSGVISKANPELSISNLTTEAVPTRCTSRLSPSRLSQRSGSNRSVDVGGRRGNNPTETEKQPTVPYFPMKDLLPAVDQNIQTKQQERYTRHSVEEYYGKIGCGQLTKQSTMAGIEALSLSLDKHMGPPAFRPHYLRSPFQRGSELNTKKTNGKFSYLPEGTESYKICTPRFYVDASLNNRSGSADRPPRVKLCLFGSMAPKSAEPRRKSAQPVRPKSLRPDRQLSFQETSLKKS